MKVDVTKRNGDGGRGLPRPVDMGKRLVITVPEAALMLGISRNHGYELIRRGELPHIKLGNRILIPIVQLEKMLERIHE